MVYSTYLPQTYYSCTLHSTSGPLSKSTSVENAKTRTIRTSSTALAPYQARCIRDYFKEGDVELLCSYKNGPLSELVSWIDKNTVQRRVNNKINVFVGIKSGDGDSNSASPCRIRRPFPILSQVEYAAWIEILRPYKPWGKVVSELEGRIANWGDKIIKSPDMQLVYQCRPDDRVLRLKIWTELAKRQMLGKMREWEWSRFEMLKQNNKLFTQDFSACLQGVEEFERRRESTDPIPEGPRNDSEGLESQEKYRFEGKKETVQGKGPISTSELIIALMRHPELQPKDESI